MKSGPISTYFSDPIATQIHVYIFFITLVQFFSDPNAIPTHDYYFCATSNHTHAYLYFTFVQPRPMSTNFFLALVQSGPMSIFLCNSDPCLHFSWSYCNLDLCLPILSYTECSLSPCMPLLTLLKSTPVYQFFLTLTLSQPMTTFLWHYLKPDSYLPLFYLRAIWIHVYLSFYSDPRAIRTRVSLIFVR